MPNAKAHSMITIMMMLMMISHLNINDTQICMHSLKILLHFVYKKKVKIIYILRSGDCWLYASVRFLFLFQWISFFQFQCKLQLIIEVKPKKKLFTIFTTQYWYYLIIFETLSFCWRIKRWDETCVLNFTTFYVKIFCNRLSYKSSF